MSATEQGLSVFVRASSTDSHLTRLIIIDGNEIRSGFRVPEDSDAVEPNCNVRTLSLNTEDQAEIDRLIHELANIDPQLEYVPKDYDPDQITSLVVKSPLELAVRYGYGAQPPAPSEFNRLVQAISRATIPH